MKFFRATFLSLLICCGALSGTNDTNVVWSVKPLVLGVQGAGVQFIYAAIPKISYQTNVIPAGAVGPRVQMRLEYVWYVRPTNYAFLTFHSQGWQSLGTHTEKTNFTGSNYVSIPHPHYGRAFMRPDYGPVVTWAAYAQTNTEPPIMALETLPEPDAPMGSVVYWIRPLE